MTPSLPWASSTDLQHVEPLTTGMEIFTRTMTHVCQISPPALSCRSRLRSPAQQQGLPPRTLCRASQDNGSLLQNAGLAAASTLGAAFLLQAAPAFADLNK